MELFPGKWYRGKNVGEFKLVKIVPTSRLNSTPVFCILTVNSDTPFVLTLKEMREEKPKAI